VHRSAVRYVHPRREPAIDRDPTESGALEGRTLRAELASQPALDDCSQRRAFLSGPLFGGHEEVVW